jgi:hypothetical protein
VAADNLELSISGFRPSAALGLLDRASATNSQLFGHSQLVAFANQQKVLLSYGRMTVNTLHGFCEFLPQLHLDT